MRTNKTRISNFYCTKCGNIGIPIMRANDKCREAGHLKKLYCVHCKETTNHCEIRPIGHYTYEDFKEEFELGRFINGERIPLKNLEKCNKNDCKYNKNGKCWNSNHSYSCEFH